MNGTKGSVSLKDVTVGLTQEEWQHLDPAQKALYRDVMLGNYCHLISVGFHMTKPDMIRKLEQGEELWTTEFFQSNLSAHSQTLIEKKPHAYSKYGKFLCRKSIFIVHQKSQTEEKPFQCPYCGNSFRRKSYLIEHQ
uniref:Uncharacterized protein n=1 Tax=Ailuropoda melanoleuca TaxID=9646 RepID=G1MCN2_AILME